MILTLYLVQQGQLVCYIFENLKSRNGIKTPIPSFVIPLILVVTGGLAAATGLAGLGIQGAQHHQYTTQLEEQRELSKIHKKLAEYQLKQIEEAEKKKKLDSLNNSFGMRGSNIPMTTTPAGGGGYMLRSITNSANLQRNLNLTNTIANQG